MSQWHIVKSNTLYLSYISYMTNNYNILMLHDLKFIYTVYSKRDTPRDCSDFYNIDRQIDRYIP